MATSNVAPSAVNAFALPNANRPQVTVTLPGSTNKVPALTAMREWVRFAVRTPNAPLARVAARTRRLPPTSTTGRRLFLHAGCASCHGGQQLDRQREGFHFAARRREIFTEREPDATSPAIRSARNI